MTVGVSKKTVSVVTAGTDYSTSGPVDVYVVDTTDATLQLATSTDVSSSSDLTGSVTIGSDADSQVIIGSGQSADTIIGENMQGNTLSLQSTNINIGTVAGNHTMYIGTGNGSPESIFIGTGAKSYTAIGAIHADNSLYLNSKRLSLGTRSGSGTELTLDGDSVLCRSNTTCTINAQNSISLVANDAGLNQQGIRTYLALGSNTAYLATTAGISPTDSLSLDSLYNYLHGTTKPSYITYGSTPAVSDANILTGHTRVYTDNGTIVLTGRRSNGDTFKAGFYESTQFSSANGFSPFTGVHMFDVQPGSNISIGDVVIVVNHTAMLTTTPNDKRVVGIVCEILENNRISVASVGDNECGQLKGFKVCNENGTISAGDLLTTSSTAGYLMKQSDDIMRSSTVGKSAVDVVFDDTNKAVDVYGFIYCG